MTREKDRRRWSLRRLAVTAAVVALCALLAGCGGGDTGDKISAPFESGKCKGMELEVVKSQLAEAGFTNIQEKPQETATEFLADSVISVKIGSNTSWNSANSWKPDTKIIIEYYAYTGIRHIDVTMDIAVGGEDGKPVIYRADQLTGRVEIERRAFLQWRTDGRARGLCGDADHHSTRR